MAVAPALMNAVGLWVQGKESLVPPGVHLVDNVVVEPHPSHPMEQPMKVGADGCGGVGVGVGVGVGTGWLLWQHCRPFTQSTQECEVPDITAGGNSPPLSCRRG